MSDEPRFNGGIVRGGRVRESLSSSLGARKSKVPISNLLEQPSSMCLYGGTGVSVRFCADSACHLNIPS
jgi:hypothetical protein